MIEPLPENVRRAGFDALQELSDRMARGSASLLRHAARLLTDDAKSHREALAQLRRYQGFEMPCSEEVAVIEGALMGLNEPESRALTERRRMENFKRDQADRKARDKCWEESWQRGGWQRRETVRHAVSRASMLTCAASCAEKNVGGEELVKALARCLDKTLTDQDPFCDLGMVLCRIDGHREEVTRAGDNVVAGPWDTAG